MTSISYCFTCSAEASLLLIPIPIPELFNTTTSTINKPKPALIIKRSAKHQINNNMALIKAVHIPDVPIKNNLDHHHNINAAFHDPLHSSSSIVSKEKTEVVGDDDDNAGEDDEMKMVMIGHRGSGMNMLYSPDQRMKFLKENSILSFNNAAKFPIHFVEFDVQVTKDDCPVIFHDNFILTQDKGVIIEKRISDITLEEFLSYGPQKEPQMVGKRLFRKTKDGRIFEWKVEKDDPLCTLQEVFQKVEHSLGFNIELKFDDNIVYKEEQLTHILQAILKVINEFANDRPIIFSSFQPDAALLIRKMQNTYPVFFLTNGGSEIYADIRRNSLEEAIKVCLEGGLQGIVSEVKAIFRDPGAISRIKESKLKLLTYGQLNNVPEVVYMQHLMGINGVIVDLVQEITEAITNYNQPRDDGEEISSFEVETERRARVKTTPQFSQRELSFLLKLIPELIRH
ncbi:glycerophosphodiester phosphodiesterase GDPD1, chloroplastic isoform X2 [Morus notabilis]|uniref:glycerophosphodiester phosphodiesterase GDPD1, chloroplastic isoform X2 n=1 Tax=Morus notabilis TaxID=981085 RepID=UPI000CECFFC7|nr:glycerophosphodiester phosphodiesterase GDPD1, chloroplastic isoform X2 [Morus notabilis]